MVEGWGNEDCDYVWNCVRAGLRPWQCLCCNGRKVSCDEHWVRKAKNKKRIEKK